jgi:anthranilate/para-aminobenzoate synthase component I
MLFTAPIKGTRPRGKDAFEDRALVQELDQDPKERAELTMIIDVERHDLGRVSQVGSVRVLAGPEIVTHRTVHHRLALLAGRARADASREEVLASMLPSGSVTGAPKVRAMEVIARLEASRRGLYTGGIGFVAHDGGVTLSMAIRTAVLRGSEGEYWTGGGIVADSDPAREVEETRWKAVQLLRAAGG